MEPRGWPNRWWEQTNLFGRDFYRAVTRQNCISVTEIFSQRPEQREQHLTRAVYDDGHGLILFNNHHKIFLSKKYVEDYKQFLSMSKFLNQPKSLPKFGMQVGIFKMQIVVFTNEQIFKWSLNQFTLIGEAFFLTRALWTEGSIKSSIILL